MKNVKIATATTIAVLFAAWAMAAEETKPKAKDKAPRLSSIAADDVADRPYQGRH